MRSTQGSIGIKRQTPYTITTDEFGLATLVETLRCDKSNVGLATPRRESPHPQYTKLVAKDIQQRFLRAELAEVTVTYRGIPEEPPEDFWSVESSTGQEAISTLKNFKDIAGTPDEPINGAIFNEETGIFEGFGPDAPDDLRGVTGFLSPSVVLAVVRYEESSVPSDVDDVGKISPPPSGLGSQLAAAYSSGDQNWLKTAAPAVQYGPFWQIRERWLRSGDNGWNTDIYGSPE